mgnify:CR=1 FL=1
MIHLRLQGNSFSGNIPNLTGLNNLEILDLSHNDLDGTIDGIPREKTIIEELFDEEPTKTEIKLQTKLEHLKEQEELLFKYKVL